MKKLLSLVLIFTMIFSTTVLGFANQNDPMTTVLEDNESIKKVETVIGNSSAIATFHKKTGKIEIVDNGKLIELDAKKSKISKEDSEIQAFGFNSRSSLKVVDRGEELYGVSYKVWRDRDKGEYKWKIHKSYISSKIIWENDDNERALSNFKSYVDTARGGYDQAKAGLVAAGVSGVAAFLLALIPEPTISKAAVVAALSAVGVSSAVVVDGVMKAHKYYHKAKDLYDEI